MYHGVYTILKFDCDDYNRYIDFTIKMRDEDWKFDYSWYKQAADGTFIGRTDSALMNCKVAEPGFKTCIYRLSKRQNTAAWIGSKDSKGNNEVSFIVGMM